MLPAPPKHLPQTLSLVSFGEPCSGCVAHIRAFWVWRRRLALPLIGEQGGKRDTLELGSNPQAMDRVPKVIIPGPMMGWGVGGGQRVGS